MLPSLSPKSVARLEAVPGLELEPGAPLAGLTTFRIGGAAELLVGAHDLEGLRELVRVLGAAGAPLQLLGLGSNVLIPDEGIAGVVVRLVGEFERLSFDGERVRSGAAVPLGRLAKRATERGLTGLEALSGFPSTVGGAVVMNAGCYGTEIVDVLETVTVLDREGEVSVLGVGELGAGYRTTVLQGSGEIVVEALFRLRRGDREAGLAKIRELNRRRWSSLPTGLPNAGSVFRNPPGAYAGKLIDECGLKGLQIGGARISRRHGNVIVNGGGATAEDVLALMRRAREEVAARFGVTLEPEVVLAGSLAKRWREAPAARV